MWLWLIKVLTVHTIFICWPFVGRGFFRDWKVIVKTLLLIRWLFKLWLIFQVLGLWFIISSINDVCSIFADLMTEGTLVVNILTLAFINLCLLSFPAFWAFLFNRLNWNDNHCDYIDSNICDDYCNECPTYLVPLVLAVDQQKREKWHANEVERDFIEDLHSVEELGLHWEARTEVAYYKHWLKEQQVYL